MSSPSKLFSCVDAKAILNNPVNDSQAKFHWSFAKGTRFAKQKGYYCHAMYDLPTTKAKRTTSFGIGKKTDLDVGKDPHNVAPPPNSYDPPTFVQTNELHNTGFNIGIGREETAPRSYIDLQAMKMPGPGTYQEFRRNESPRWTMRPRTSSQLYPKTTQRIVPGPGNYKHYQAISPEGRYSYSKYKNSLSKTWNPKCSGRFRKSSKVCGDEATDVPGPGTYRPKNDLSGSGDYVLSTNKSAGHRKMLMGGRKSFVDELARRSQTPGPGSYRTPSDFGIYDHLYHDNCSHVVTDSSTFYTMKMSQSQIIDVKSATPATSDHQ